MLILLLTLLNPTMPTTCACITINTKQAQSAPKAPEGGDVDSSEEFDWGPVDDVKDSEMEETDVGSDCGGSKPKADGQVAMAKKIKKGQKPKRELLAQVTQQKNTMQLKKDVSPDTLLTLLPLPVIPPTFQPGTYLSQEQLDELHLNKHLFLWPEELKLLQHILKLHESGHTWIEDKKGHFQDDYFSPVKIPIVEHVPWAHRNLPFHSSILGNIIQIFKDKFTTGVCEHFNASYSSHFFCIKKKSSMLHLVHNLQPLNAVTIHNSSIPPFTDQLIKTMAGRACYTMLDLFVRYDCHMLHINSQDLTTIWSPIGVL
ncbi:hypothetical protein F5148DRAFT_1285857 [Russula earlei]|uniref:Uncharacterized protein n=1 Tax=Russula earlei TaxID=71964 RepID=A0ACC0U725_9AGAM|nr:hypothetical protein F5148DRAFT_1285857 [Russula earlei]